MIDLHTHTRHSDGDRTPAELLAEAARHGIEVLAVTDHDTVSGIAESRAAARQHGIRLVPGIEISCEFAGREIHMLGHFVDPQAASLGQLASAMLLERRERMERMVGRAQDLGFSDVTMQRVIERSGGANLGRPHLARVLVDCGHASSIADAFDRFLGTGRPMWADRRRITVAEALAFIREAGGTSSLAHPGVNQVSLSELGDMATLGLDAVEAQHPSHPPEQAAKLEDWANALGLLITAGSDYHGPTVKPDLQVGNRTLSRERFSALEERSQRR